MQRGGVGGANTKTGLVFELNTNLITFLRKQKGYTTEKISGYKKAYFIYYKNEQVARTFPTHDLYTFLRKKHNVDWSTIFSKKLLPDDALYVFLNNTVYIIEKKNQQGAGSVDEKLQTCDFKRKQYKKLFSRLNYEVEYIYLLADWFKHPSYKDMLDYVISVGCHYYFEYIPLQKLGLPTPK
ncbi:MAG: hypothetical protein WC845_01650 [Candidatus Staskawiczbacteria bacterium]|jgi:hypothetical protein